MAPEALSIPQPADRCFPCLAPEPETKGKANQERYPTTAGPKRKVFPLELWSLADIR